MKRLAVALFVVGASLPAFADPGKVVVTTPDPGRVEGARARALDGTVKDVFARVLGDRAIFANEKASCARDPACVKNLVDQHGADEVAWIGYEGTGAGVTLVVESRDASGRVVASARQKVSSTSVASDLVRMTHLVFAPSRFTGKLVVDNVPPGGQVLVDEVPLPQAGAQVVAVLSVGEHRVGFVAPRATSQEPVEPTHVDIPFAGQVVLQFKSPQAGEAQAPTAPAKPDVGSMPVWPAIATGVAAAAGGGVAITVIVVELLEQEVAHDAGINRRRAIQGTEGLAINEDPADTAWEGHGPLDSADRHAAIVAAGTASLATFDLATTLSLCLVSSGTAIMIAGGVAASTLFVRWATDGGNVE